MKIFFVLSLESLNSFVVSWIPFEISASVYLWICSCLFFSFVRVGLVFFPFDFFFDNVWFVLFFFNFLFQLFFLKKKIVSSCLSLQLCLGFQIAVLWDVEKWKYLLNSHSSPDFLKWKMICILYVPEIMILCDLHFV